MNDELKKYFKEEFTMTVLRMEHQKPWEFYLSPWQRTTSVLPLLFWRLLLFILSLIIILSSILMYIQKDIIQYWLIFLSNWGLILMILATGFALLISLLSYKNGPIRAEIGLPWYMKTYGVLQNIAVPVAFVITVAFFGFIYGTKDLQDNLNFELNIYTHALNSLVMFLSLISVSHPTRILHVYQPILFTFIYVIFNVIYYYAGGVNPHGDPWVYSVVYWKYPDYAIASCVITAVWMILFHLLTAALAKLRDYLAKKLLKKFGETND